MFSSPMVNLRAPGQASPTLATISVKVADAVWLHGIRVVNGRAGIFVELPERRGATGRHEPVYQCVSLQVRRELDGLVLTAYDAAITNRNSRVPAALQ